MILSLSFRLKIKLVKNLIKLIPKLFRFEKFNNIYKINIIFNNLIDGKILLISVILFFFPPKLIKKAH